MKKNIIYCLVSGFLSAPFLTEAQSGLIEKADSIQQTENFRAAATAYERAYFFSEADDVKVRALFGRAAALKLAGEYNEAYNSLVRVLKFELNDSTLCSANYLLAFNLYMAGYYTDAEKYCARNYSLPVHTDEYIRSLMLHGLIYNELLKYDMAQEKFMGHLKEIQLPAKTKDSLATYVQHYFQEKNQPDLKSLKKARRLSMFLPGAGLFYAGKPGKALLNISLQLLAAGYTAANVCVGNYLTAGTAGFWTLASFYTGGINQLNEIVPPMNEKRAKKYNDTFKSIYVNAIVHPIAEN